MPIRLSRRASRTLALAREEAGRLRHDYIGTEHLLLGMICDREGTAAKVLLQIGLDLEDIRVTIEEQVPPGFSSLGREEIAFASGVDRTIESSLKEAHRMGHQMVDVEHLLLGLIGEGDGVAARTLMGLGADRKQVREEIMKLLASARRAAPSP